MTKDSEVKIFDILNDISYTKVGILDETNISQYNPYMVNRWLSMSIDTVMYAQEMNTNAHLPKDMQYDYYFHAIKKNKRYFKYVKHTKQNVLDVICEYYNCGERKAKELLRLFSESDIEYMQSKLNKGGKSAR
jgi:hypothetical protein